MSVPVLAPCAGRVVALADVPDEVFASEMVGPGVAIEPAGGRTTVVSPVAGRVVKIHPHAFVVLADCGAGVLVHLGIDTNRLGGRRLRGAGRAGRHGRARHADGGVGPRRGR